MIRGFYQNALQNLRMLHVQKIETRKTAQLYGIAIDIFRVCIYYKRSMKCSNAVIFHVNIFSTTGHTG